MPAPDEGEWNWQHRAEVRAVDGGVDLVVMAPVGEGDELVLVVGEPGRRAQVEDLAAS